MSTIQPVTLSLTLANGAVAHQLAQFCKAQHLRHVLRHDGWASVT
jgi:hypothetical protein